MWQVRGDVFIRKRQRCATFRVVLSGRKAWHHQSRRVIKDNDNLPARTDGSYKAVAELPKNYDPNGVEPQWYQRWLAAGAFRADAKSAKPPFSIVIPPPNVTGMLTLGHVLNNTIQDILARRARMRGCEVLWLPGMDHAGVATQTAVEKWLRKNENVGRRELGREEFIRRVWDWKEKHGGIIIEQLKRLGCSCDWSRERFTLDDGYSRAVQRVFVELHKKGLIYRGRRMINWDPVALTALSDEEVIPTPTKSALYYVRYQSTERPEEYLEVATTRPETIMADVAIAVHPADERYQTRVGQKVWRPLAREPIPVIADEAIDPKFGTGILKVTPAHDQLDFEIGTRHKLPAIDVLSDDGRISCPAVPELHGLDRFAAREKAAEILRERGLLSKTEPHESNVGFSERAGVPIEPRLSEQWFLHYPKTREALRVVQWGAISRRRVQVVSATGHEFHGSNMRELRKAAVAYARRHQFLGSSFVNEETKLRLRVGRGSLSHIFSNRGGANIRAIAVLPELIRTAIWTSTQPHDPPNPLVKHVHHFLAAFSLGGELYRVQVIAKEFHDGTIYYDHKAKKRARGGKSLEAHLPREKLDTQPAPNATLSVNELTDAVNAAIRFFPAHWEKVYAQWLENIRDWCISRQVWWGHRIPAWYRGGEMCVQIDSPGENWVQDPDTLDTWFSSWLWAFETMDAETRAKFYPTSVLVTAADIIFFWVARMIIAGLEFKPGTSQRDEDNIPFRDVFFTGLIRDKQGRKMSKSLGNSPDPLELMAKYGADGLRFGLMRMAPSGQDIRFDEKQIEEGRNFATKLWNVARFRQMHGPSQRELQLNSNELSIYAIELLARLNETIAATEASYGEYQFNAVAQRLYDFVWGDFCDWFVEAGKTDIFGDDPARKNSALATMDYVLSAIVRLLHPFMPHVTDELWSRLGFAARENDFLDFVSILQPFDLGEKSRVQTARARVRAIYSAVEVGRNLRAEARLPSNRKARYALRADLPWAREQSATLSRLLNAESLVIEPHFQPPPGASVSAITLGELFLLRDESDRAGEIERLNKEIAKLETDLKGTEAKLANSAFTQRAPAAVVEEHQRRRDDLTTRLAQLRQARASLD